ncbi:hypothetical protein CONCODRAFT_77303 [Conidiobolus coronatus NRRL 28638]|uniref:FIST domain-containing protein n=1 Tax=Conidiobolus coronatus (strain ATCC 28846 / CBS 209.66 / NRRL 28638) TaxID=796925 RepID=A0A137PEX5_CONC2|nr:hypothetical protein CONCODRAFT_77303 [Conidiobolus coronatus NRRL 28638]|eukprot:KXN73559.1 hypothetical protein CONCODRAFT_77303 [Conidiobolus coronatus NRRL 28638]
MLLKLRNLNYVKNSLSRFNITNQVNRNYHLKHFISDSKESAVESSLKSLYEKTKGENYNFGYLLIGSGYSQSELERIPKLLDSLLPNIPFQVGLVAEKIGFGTNSKGIRLIAGKKESTDRIGAYPFYFHSPDAKKWLTSNDDRSQPKWDRSDDVLKSVSQPTNHVALPQEFIDIGKQYEPGSTLLLGTDGHPDQYLEAISNSLPHLKIVGLSGGPTPFINGKATSLIYNGKVNEEGIIGVILPPSANISTKLVYPNIQTLGEPLTITKARGNIILEMNESNATQHLLKSLQTTNIPSSQYKHIDFFLGLLPKDCTESPQDISIYRIQSGSPTKGTMAIDTIRDIELDQKILLSWMVPSKEFEMYTGSNVTSENGIVYSTKPYFTKICLPGTRVEFDFN